MVNLNSGIVKLVDILNKYNFKTTDSGDGKTHDFPCDREYPYVVISVEPMRLIGETVRLKAVMENLGITFHPIGTPSFAPNLDFPCIQGSYDPANNTAFIELMNVLDVMFLRG